MSTKTFSTRENGALFIQPGGPNTKPYYLGCHDLGDIAQPGGKITLVHCLDGAGGWKTVGFTKAPPDPVTFTLGTFLGRDADFIENLGCPATLFVNMRDCGKADLFENYVRTFILNLASLTSTKLIGLVKRETDATALVEVDAEALPPVVRAFAMTARRASIIETANLNDVDACDTGRCSGPCGGGVNDGDMAVAVSTALNASPSNKSDTWITTDGGSWNAAAAQPFAGGVDIGNVACFAMGRSTVRRLVTLGETVAGQPMRVAYTDDNGATWTVVNVGAVNGQFAADSSALFVLDPFNIWLVTSAGYIYYSSDGGVTWVTQEAGSITAGTYHGVSFSDERNGWAVAAANVVVRTVDGGLTWAATNGPIAATILNTVAAVDANHAWVGAANGRMYFTADAGLTWNERTFSGAGVGSVDDIQFWDENVGFMISNTAAPVGTIFETINGGYSWQAIATPTNSGLNALAVVNPGLVYAVGPATGGTAVLLRVTGG